MHRRKSHSAQRKKRTCEGRRKTCLLRCQKQTMHFNYIALPFKQNLILKYVEIKFNIVICVTTQSCNLFNVYAFTNNSQSKAANLFRAESADYLASWSTWIRVKQWKRRRAGLLFAVFISGDKISRRRTLCKSSTSERVKQSSFGLYNRRLVLYNLCNLSNLV